MEVTIAALRDFLFKGIFMLAQLVQRSREEQDDLFIPFHGFQPVQQFFP